MSLQVPMTEQGSEAKFAKKVKLGEGKGRPKTSFVCSVKNWLKGVPSSMLNIHKNCVG